jgi:hypothetical protein
MASAVTVRAELEKAKRMLSNRIQQQNSRGRKPGVID